MTSTLPLTFAALGDTIRFAIVERLLNNGKLSAGELLDVADVSAPAISRHLKVLREAGIVTQTVVGQKRIYAVRPGAVAEINTWMMSHEAFWSASLDRLEAVIDEDDDV